MVRGSDKVFKDAVHGYVRVPRNWCEKFVDTPLFQRLRHVEQTSMRCLFPSARHDRFIHSLGTYHLGAKAFESLKRNAAPLIRDLPLRQDELQGLETTFLLACLLHDCAHSPFSHTFESHYNRGDRLDSLLRDGLSSDARGMSDLAYCTPAAHEKASAALILQAFADDMRTLGGDPCLAARMVMGCVYHGASEPRLRFYNALISLLNGRAIDVDKLDYITRDTWASGVVNVGIDIDRLLGSVTAVLLRDQIIRIAYLETALSVLQSVVDARNFLYTWVYSHHKVIYDQHLLTTAVERVVSELSPNGLQELFSLDALREPIQLGPLRMYRPADGDLIYLLKSHGAGVPEAQEWLSRQHSRRAVWKTCAQYNQVFRQLNESELNAIERTLNDKQKLAQWWSEQRLGGSPVVRGARIRLYEIGENELLVQLSGGDKVLCYTEAVAGRAAQWNSPTPKFYLYVPKSETIDTADLVKSLVGLA
jgi:HD superfamily phosphohydrolase